MSMPASPFQPPDVLPTFDKIVRAWEKLRDLNTGGFGHSVVGQIKGAGKGWPAPDGSKTLSCSPFTGTVMGMIFSKDDDFPYQPVFNGGESLPGAFYTLQNGDLNAPVREFLKKHDVDPDRKKWRLDNTLQDSAGAACWFNLATPIGYCWRDPDSGKSGRDGKPEQMRRGDLLKIEWYSQPNKKGERITSGHATFCWDVHLDENGNVDAFQFISANGNHAGGVGVSVVLSSPDSRFVKKVGNKYVKTDRNNFLDILEGKDYPEYAEEYAWYALPDIKPDSIEKSTFRRPRNPKARIVINYHSDFLYAREIKVARLHGITPPDPYPQPGSDPAAAGKHFVAVPTTVPAAKARDSKPQETKAQDPKGPADVPHTKVTQLPGAATTFQLAVEQYLQIFYKAKWIAIYPGTPDAVNDSQSQAAIKEFQQKYSQHKPDGIADKDTRDRMRFFAEYALKQRKIETQLRNLKDAGKLDTDPGTPDDERDEKSTAALKEFQKKNGLDVDGIPGPHACGALDDAVAELARPAAATTPAPDCPQESELRKKILEAARAEVGMKVDPKGTYDDPKGRIPIYFKVAFGHESKGAYCAAFATYCWKTAGTQLKSSAWVPKLYQIFEKAGRIIPPGGQVKPGDMAFVQGRGAGRSSNKNKDGDYLDTKGDVWPCHVGLVAEVKGNKVVETIEGNWNPGDGHSGVYEVPRPDYYEGRLCGFGSLVAPGEAAAPAGSAKPDAPKPTPARHDAPLAPEKPALLWGTTSAKAGEIVDLRLHARGLAPVTPPLVMLIDGKGAETAAEAPAAAAVVAQVLGFVPLQFPDFLHLFIFVPHAADGTRYKARVSVPLKNGTRATVATEDELVIGEHECELCKELKKLDDAAFAAQVHSGKGAGAKTVTLVQKMLVKLGYDLGKTKQFPDGADGQYGETGAHALRYFTREASADAPVFQRMDPFHPDAKLPIVKLLADKCAQGFKKTWPKPARPPSKAAPDPQLPEIHPLPPITSSKIQVAGKDFVQWFNKDFQPPRNVKMGIADANGKDSGFFENRISNEAAFRKVFDQIAALSGKEETPLAEFVAFFCVFYNEQGGTFVPKAEAYNSDEVKNFTYLWKQVDGGKVSYNRPNNKQKLAGDQLVARGVISKAEVEAWNVQTPFPEVLLKKRPELTPHLRECDFYKFQGRGLTQITWREAYEKYVVPALKEAGGYPTDLDEITTDQMQRAFEDPKVYLRAVYHEWHAGQVGRALPDADNDPPEFLWIGYHIGGSANYGRRFHLRCMELFQAMVAGNYTCQ